MSHVSDPAKYAVAVTPSDSTVLNPTRSLYIGVSGNLSVVINGQTVAFANVPVGILPVEVTRVRATGTTASSIVALW